MNESSLIHRNRQSEGRPASRVAICPYSESISFLSDSSLTIIIVLEKVRATETQTALIWGMS